MSQKTAADIFPSEWNLMQLGDLFEANAGGDYVPERSSDVPDSRYPYPIYANGLTQQGLYGFSNYAEEPADSITVTARGTLGQAFYRDTPFVAIGRLLVLKPKVLLDARFFCEYINYGIHFAVESTGVPQLTAPQISRYLLPVPPESEQRAIAKALSDVDGSLSSLEALIAKKQAIKQVTMQQLLTGKTRLPRFSEEWEPGILADFGIFRSGSGFPLEFQGHQSGDYPFFKVSDLSGEGNQLFMNKANHYISESVRRKLGAIRFEPGSIVFAKIGAAIFLERKRLLSQESCLDNNMMAFTLTNDFACPRFFYYIFLHIELGKLVSTTALPALSGRHIGTVSILIPPIAEQQAIASILSDMDAEIGALEQRRDKTRAIKQAMMQQLLTGRVRLVKPDPSTTSAKGVERQE